MVNVSLNFSDVSFGFHGNDLLFEGLTLSIGNTNGLGKIIALMGPSGIGKSTFCELMLGIHKPRGGSITFEPKKPNVALIPQKGIVFEELSIEENIACLKHSTTLGPTFRQEMVNRAAETLGLMDLLHKSASSKLSGGEAQRVMLARIQTIKCDLLILDEPCSFLDNMVKGTFLAQVRQTIDKSSMLALMVTHIWNEARLIADEVIFFNRIDGNTVTLHPVTTLEAEERPPTIDALYGIWWPNCRHVNFDDAITLLGRPIEGIPASTHIVGLHSRNSAGESAPHDWACQLWARIEKNLDENNRRMLGVLNKDNSAGHIMANFYDKNGVLATNNY